jgi:photosystem II stability/assembly factor-like uncharacterized protein
VTQVKVMVGTRKGAWVYTSDAKRESWEVSEPILPGWTVYHVTMDARGRQPRMLAAANHWAWGRSVARSDDMGKTWEQRSPGLAFPKDMEISVGNVWVVSPGHESQPGVVYAGTQPAGLFRSEDGGESWAPVDSLNRHDWRQYWTGSGGGESTVHSIVVDPRDPQSMYVSISTGGTFFTNDGAKTWDYRNHRVFAMTKMALDMMKAVSEMLPDFQIPVPPNVDPASANEFHKVKLDPKNPDRLWGQAHIGVFRSDNQGKDWVDVTEGLPSFHGFPIAVTKQDPDATFVVPLAFEADNFRVVPGQFTVWRTTDQGKSWQPLTNGLPGPHDYQSAYREAMDTDGLDSEGVYVGTSNGMVYASPDLGEHWLQLPGRLPPVLSVSACVVD